MVVRKALVINADGLAGELPAGDTLDGVSSASTFTVVSSATNASAGDRLTADVSGGTFTITLPNTPNIGDQISINDLNREFSTTNLTVDPNGQDVEDQAGNFILDVDGITANMEYISASFGWKVEFTF